MKCRLQILILAALAVANAHAYYFWTQYQLNGAPYNPAPQKYDLTAIPNNTVTFYATDSGPSFYTGNDSFASVLSQIRQAAAAWNSVATSNLRIAFGGLYSAGTPQTTPGGQVIFEQLPPGILGFGGVSAKADISTSSTKNFYPIVTSYLHLTTDLTQAPGPSYSQFFFLDVVHEMGHALGLQHTFTSSAMSQATTRTTTLLRTIDADDVAGISVLYPSAAFTSQFGSISGRVLFTNGQPVHLASVVAIRAGASAVSAFTNPDGSYRIDGIPPGTYFVYAHPMPPDGNVVSPLDPRGNAVAPSGPFATSFYPGTPSVNLAAPVQVTVGAVQPNINFSVTALPSVPLYDVLVFSYVNGNYVSPAYVNENAPDGTATAIDGVGIFTNGSITPGLTEQILGGAATVYGSAGYGDQVGNNYLAMYLYNFALATPPGPQHLVFSLPNYTYILSNAVNLTLLNPPAINSIFSNSDGSVTLTGTNFQPDSRFYFDGSPLAVRSVDPVNGIAIAVPPTGASGQHATAMAVNDDGENSLSAYFTYFPGESAFLEQGAPPTYAYAVAPQPTLTLSPSFVPAGAEAMIDIVGVNTNFVQGQTIVGFGSSDVYVRQVFVLSPTHLQVDVSIPAAAAQTFTEVSVITGFQSAVQPGGFLIAAFNPGLPVTSPLLVNDAAGQTAIYPGAIVSVFGSNLSQGNALPAVVFNGIPALVLFASPTQLNLQIPSSLQPGVATMQLANGLGVSYPVDIAIAAIPNNVVGLLNTSGVSIDTTHPAHAGDAVTVLVSNFADPATSVATSRVQVSIGSVSAPALIVAPYGTSLFQIQTIMPSVPSGSQPLSVYLDGRMAAQGTISIQ